MFNFNWRRYVGYAALSTTIIGSCLLIGYGLSILSTLINLPKAVLIAVVVVSIVVVCKELTLHWRSKESNEETDTSP